MNFKSLFNKQEQPSPKTERPVSNLSTPAAIMITIAGLGLLIEKGFNKSSESLTDFKNKMEQMSPSDKANYAKSVYKIFESKQGNLGDQSFRFFSNGEIRVLDIQHSNGGTYVSALFDSTSAESKTPSVEGSVDKPSFKQVFLFDDNSDGTIDRYTTQRATGLELPTTEGEVMYTTISNHGEIGYESIPAKRGGTITPEEQVVLDEINSSVFPMVLKTLENESANIK